MTWSCPQCKRKFTRKNQRHTCGTGDSTGIVRDRPRAIVQVYRALEAFAKSLGPIEVVARDRYALFRGVRIFTDVVVMSNAVRVAVHLGKRADHPLFFKIVAGERFVTHVAKLTTLPELTALEPFVKQAYAFSIKKA